VGIRKDVKIIDQILNRMIGLLNEKFRISIRVTRFPEFPTRGRARQNRNKKNKCTAEQKPSDLIDTVESGMKTLTLEPVSRSAGRVPCICEDFQMRNTKLG
jgi:hypothetical protein